MSTHERLRRDRDRQRRRRRDARPPARRRRARRSFCWSEGDWLTREPQNWRAEDVFVDGRYQSEDTWYDDEGQGVPAAGPLLRRRRDQDVRCRALPPPCRGLRRAPSPRRHLPRMADLLRRDGAPLHAGRAALPGPRCTGRGPDRAAGKRATIPSPPSATSRESSSSPTTSPPPATSRSTLPAG